jgi:tetratricopeptide (TPR) repeat protein
MRSRIKDFSEAIRLEPDAHIPYQARAAVYHAVHEYDKALADLTDAIRLAPEVGLLYNDRGCVYKSLDNYPKAQEQFNEAIRVDPKLALAYSNRGVNWHVQKQYEKAMADFDKALEIDPKLAHAYAFRGYVWSKEGHYNQALKDWDEAIRVAPDEPWGYYNKARLYAACESVGHRDGQLALENAQKACELSAWEEWIYIATLAAAYAELGQFDEAIKWQKKAIAMNKNPEERDRSQQQDRLNLYEAGLPFRDPEVSQ